MKYTTAQQIMINDGLPASLIVSQEQRNKYWLEHPPKPYVAPYREESMTLTEAEIRLLFELKDSKERGAASMGCLNHRLEPIASLERKGFAKGHPFASTSFCITDAGVKESNKHKRPENIVTEEMTTGLGWKSAKAAKAEPSAPKAPRTRSVKGRASDIVALMRKPGGCTSQEVLDMTGWKAVSMPQQAKLGGVTLVIDKSCKPYRYKAQ